MSDVLKGLAGNLAYLTAWLLPSFFGVGIFAIAIYPSIARLPFVPSATGLSDAGAAGIIIGGAVLVGFLLNIASTPLYRFLEGYSVLYPFKTRRRKRMLAKRNKLLIQYERARDNYADAGYATNLLLEAARLFPTADSEVTPTRLGNAIRSFETYAWRQYRLDSQTLWEPLWAVIPQALRDEHDRARAGVDFCVASMMALLVFGGVVLGVWLGAWFINDGLTMTLVLVGTIGPVALLALFYRLALSGCLTWGITVKGIVEAGRVPLAELLGLRLPATLKEEREMWEIVSRFTRESQPDANWEGRDAFDRWRRT